jgi:ribonuclease P protein subunit RPR2
VRALAAAVEAKDGYTGEHIQRVHEIGLLLARAVAPDQAGDPQLAYGFLLHDIGKLSVPDAVLKKPGPLDDREWALMRRHPEAGARILDAVPFLDRALDVVLRHHERWDGRGYPGGLGSDEIPLWARIFAVADTVDAITSDRPYRLGRPLDDAIDEILARAGSQFDPDCAEALGDLDRGAVRDLVGSAA